MNNTFFFNKIKAQAELMAVLNKTSYDIQPVKYGELFSCLVDFKDGTSFEAVNYNDECKIINEKGLSVFQVNELEEAYNVVSSTSYLDGLGIGHSADDFANCKGVDFKYDGDVEKPRVFLDMDGVLATFHTDKTMEEVFSDGYFKNLEPIPEGVALANRLALRDDIEVCILSKSNYSRSQDAIQEKIEWLQEHCSNIKPSNYYFVPLNSDKRDFIPNLSEKDILIDDYIFNFYQRTEESEQDIKNGYPATLKEEDSLWEGKKILFFNDITRKKSSYNSYALQLLESGNKYLNTTLDECLNYNTLETSLDMEIIIDKFISSGRSCSNDEKEIDDDFDLDR